MRSSLFALALVLAAPANAQISPGPLARAHAALDRNSDCVKCHVRGEDMSRLCMSCHTEIRDRVAARKGFHGLEGRDACQSCHPDHAGRDFELIDWGRGGFSSFDHRRAGWALQGKHAETECRDCHQPKNLQAPMAAHLQVKDHSRTWLALDRACQSCHEDPHETRFGNDCLKCHGQTNWSTIKTAGFDHDLTRYPLRGKHAELECETCHDERKAWGRKPRFDTCTACHSDAHADNAKLEGKSVDCVRCHSVSGFHPATMPIAAHTVAATGYALEGRHRAVACASCHTKDPKGVAPAVLGTAHVWMQPAHDACESCHRDPHGDQLKSVASAACESCHDPSAFSPSLFTVKDHAKLTFELEAAHAKTECRACHDAKRKDLPAPKSAPSGRAAFVFAIQEHDCASCHHDPHQGRLDAQTSGDGTCLTCHDLSRFHPSRVDAKMHDRFDFSLDGAHAAIPCGECHEELVGREPASSLLLAAHGPALTFERDAVECASCHESPHGRQFDERRDRGACDACHDSEAFAPASRFDHNRDARFKLEGAHATTDCAGCHTSRGAGAAKTVVYRGTPSECTACHTDGEAGSRKAIAPILRPLSVREFDHARVH